MTQAQHAKGPWYQHKKPAGTITISSNPMKGVSYGHVCNVGSSNLTPEAQAISEANARLIAASPSMYEFISKLANSGDKEAISTLDSLGLGY